MEGRRYVVKLVSTSPAWTGIIWSVACKHFTSAERLYERHASKIDPGSGSALLLMDRHARKVVRSVGSTDPKKTAIWFGW